MKLIFDYNRTLFNPESGQVFPGVFGMLKKLSKKHELILVTLNSPGRKNSAAIVDMQPYFSEVHFVERKTAKHFSELISGEATVIVIGDSLEGEIKAGIELDLITIHIQSQLEKRYYKTKRPTHSVTEVTRILPIIENYE